MSISSGKSYLEKALDSISNMTDDELKEWIEVIIDKEDKWVNETDMEVK